MDDNRHPLLCASVSLDFAFSSVASIGVRLLGQGRKSQVQLLEQYSHPFYFSPFSPFGFLHD
jgi:hypothetical protein